MSAPSLALPRFAREGITVVLFAIVGSLSLLLLLLQADPFSRSLPCEAGEQPCQVFCAGGGFQWVRVRIMQFKMVSSLRMQAVSATFGALPAASSLR